MPFETLVQTYLFTPLGMKHSYLTWPPEIDTTFYAGRFDEHGRKYPIEKSMVPNAAASLITTIEDYTNFALACLKGKGLSTMAKKEIRTIQIQVRQASHVGMGLG